MDQSELATSIRHIDARTKRIEERSTRIEEQSTRIEERMTGIDERATRLEDRMTAIDERMARLEDRMTGIDERTERIEQILPTFVTKDDAKAFLTKDDAKAFLTKDDARAFATKDDVREDGERTRRHFDVVAEEMKASIAVIAEGHEATRVYVDGGLAETRTALESHDKRIMKLEAKSVNTSEKPKRRSTRRDP